MCPAGVATGRSLSVFLSHPIQHFIPWLRALNSRLDGRLMVHYASRHGLDARLDPEFGSVFAWDMDLVSGYPHRFWEADRPQGPDRGFWGIRYPNLRAALAQERPTAILVWGWLFAGYWQAALTARTLSIPYFIRGESNLLGTADGPRWWVKQQTVGRLCRGAEACLSIGTRNTDLYRAYGVPPERIRTAPYFVDNDWFESEAARLMPTRDHLRQRFGLPPDAVVFLFMGKLIPKKHPETLIRAWRRLPDALRRRSALLVAGSGPLADDLGRASAGDPRIVFCGLLNRNELPQAYVASDVLVLPSDAGETWGLVVNEAMACGLPAIVSDMVGSGPELVVPDSTGLTFPLGDEAALSAHLERLVADPSLGRRLGASARSHVRSTASVTRAVDTMISALEAVPVRESFTRPRRP